MTITDVKTQGEIRKRKGGEKPQQMQAMSKLHVFIPNIGERYFRAKVNQQPNKQSLKFKIELYPKS